MILTPYPGTPLFKRLVPLIVERDWERLDGFAPTYTHPAIPADSLQLLLGHAYTQFYMRPSFLANYLRINRPAVRLVVSALDTRVKRRHARREGARLGAAAC